MEFPELVIRGMTLEQIEHNNLLLQSQSLELTRSLRSFATLSHVPETKYEYPVHKLDMGFNRDSRLKAVSYAEIHIRQREYDTMKYKESLLATKSNEKL